MNTNIASKVFSACAALGISAFSMLLVTDASAHEAEAARLHVQCSYRSFGPAHRPTRDTRVRQCEYREQTLARQTAEVSREGSRKSIK